MTPALSTTSGNGAATRGFTLRLPESWYEFDVWRATHTGDLARLVDRRVAAEPDLEQHRGALLRLLRQLAEDAERKGALLVGAMLETVDDAGMLVASMTVFQTEGAPDEADNTVEAIAGQLTAVAPAEGSSTWRRVGVVELPAGRAVRVAGVETSELGSRSLDCVVMQTLIPVPGGRGVLDVVLTSPQVELAEGMLDLFEAISATLAWSSETPALSTEGT